MMLQKAAENIVKKQDEAFQEGSEEGRAHFFKSKTRAAFAVLLVNCTFLRIGIE
jgi:hypothetical protein